MTTMTATPASFRPALFAKAGVLAAAVALTLQAGSSKAQEAPGDFVQVFATTLNTNSIIVVGDKEITNFKFNDFTVDPSDTFNFEQITVTDYQFQYNFFPAQRSNASGSFSYTVNITPAGLAAGNSFRSFQSNITGAVNNAPGAFTTTVTTDKTGATPATSNSSGTNPSKFVVFSPDETSATFTQTFNLSGGANNATLNSLGVLLKQKVPSAEVPGPLPILGAAAAFGFSRKLRSRIKQVA